MQSLFARWMPAATLATWSAVLLYFHFSQRMHSMLASEFRIYALVAAVLLAVMALCFVAFKGDATCCSSGECGHGLSRYVSGKLLTFSILLVPIVVAARFDPSGGFSKSFVENRGVATTKEQLGSLTPRAQENKVPDYIQHTATGILLPDVLDLLYAAQDSTLRKDFDGKRVELVGQFMPDSSNNASGKRFKAVRMTMTCCAADAQPIATLVETEKLSAFPEMTWVKITGVSTFPIEKGRRISVLMAEKVEKTEPPAEAMIY